MLLAVLEVIAPQFKHFDKLRDFVSMKLPPGFPIQVRELKQGGHPYPIWCIVNIPTF